MRERVRQLAGQLEVEFRPDGTRVHASLPVKASPGEATEQSEAEFFGESGDRKAEARVASESRKRILIVDDHEVMRRGVRGLLESHEEWAVCGEAVEGHEAVRKTRELNPDLLILDVSMPGISGVDAALQILKENPKIKILFFTMHESPQMMREIANVGAQGYVAKARAGNDLINAVRIILGGKKFFPRISAVS
jgi:CheY-like chemotaxis protein